MPTPTAKENARVDEEKAMSPEEKAELAEAKAKAAEEKAEAAEARAKASEEKAKADGASPENRTKDAKTAISLSIGMDYFFESKLFENLAQLELPAKIAMPKLSAFKIVNMRVDGLQNIERTDETNMTVVAESRLQLSGSLRVAKVQLSFMLRALGLPVDFVHGEATDTRVQLKAIAHIIPGGAIHMEQLEVTLGTILVHNTGFTGKIVTKMMASEGVKTKVNNLISSGATAKLREELKNRPLPQ